jgi:hypothetical protein
MSAANSPSPYETLYFQGDPGDGIGTYNLKDVLDTLFPFDYDGDGKQDLFLYRPGGKEAFVLHTRAATAISTPCARTGWVTTVSAASTSRMRWTGSYPFTSLQL